MVCYDWQLHEKWLMRSHSKHSRALQFTSAAAFFHKMKEGKLTPIYFTRYIEFLTCVCLCVAMTMKALQQTRERKRSSVCVYVCKYTQPRLMLTLLLQRLIESNFIRANSLHTDQCVFYADHMFSWQCVCVVTSFTKAGKYTAHIPEVKVHPSSPFSFLTAITFSSS